jgi:SAM-dependent methyltransferase
MPDSLRVSLRSVLDRQFYATCPDDWSAVAYRDLACQYLSPHATLLDFGAGRGLKPQHHFGGVAARVVGVDIDAAVLENRYLDETKVMAPGGPIPYAENSFDVVISANVLEHVQDPDAVFREIRRVLRPGGVFVFQTPNKRHYVPAIARLTPHSFHVWVARQRGNKSRDVFPTVYRANTVGAIRQLARRHALTIDHLETIEGRPEYLRTFSPLYPLGILYERMVNATPLLAPLRVVILGALRKGAVEP